MHPSKVLSVEIPVGTEARVKLPSSPDSEHVVGPGRHEFAFSTWKPYREETPLLASGLLGPVQFESVRQADVRR